MTWQRYGSSSGGGKKMMRDTAVVYDRRLAVSADVVSRMTSLWPRCHVSFEETSGCICIQSDPEGDFILRSRRSISVYCGSMRKAFDIPVGSRKAMALGPCVIVLPEYKRNDKSAFRAARAVAEMAIDLGLAIPKDDILRLLLDNDEWNTLKALMTLPMRSDTTHVS